MSTRTVVTTPSEREVMVTRRFAASVESLFAAYTRPELVKRWLNGPTGWALEVCDIDLRVGGQFRYEWHHTDGETMGMRGEYKEIVVPSRLVTTELFDEDWTGGETTVTTTFREEGDGATVRTRILYSSREARDGALQTDMADGMEASFSTLERALRAATNSAAKTPGVKK